MVLGAGVGRGTSTFSKMLFRNKTILRFPERWILHLYWDAKFNHMCIRLNFQWSYLHLWGKLKERVWTQICTRGYKKLVMGQTETSGLFKSPVNLKALTQTSSVLPNMFWHGLKNRICCKYLFHHSKIYQELYVCNSHYWHFDIICLFLNITCKFAFYSFSPYLIWLWV